MAFLTTKDAKINIFNNILQERLSENPIFSKLTYDNIAKIMKDINEYLDNYIFVYNNSWGGYYFN